jgi:hypothetical protein
MSSLLAWRGFEVISTCIDLAEADGLVLVAYRMFEIVQDIKRLNA